MSSNLPNDYRKSSILTSSEYIERIKQQTDYIYRERFQYEQQNSFPPILGPSFNGGGSSDRSLEGSLRTIAGGYQFYEAGGTLEEILPSSAFVQLLTVTLSIYQMGSLLCSWEPHPNSTSYTIDFYEESFSGSPLYTYSPVSGTTLYTTGEFPIQSGRRYGVRVKGVDEAASGAAFSSFLLYSFTASVSIQQVGSLFCAWDARPGYTSFTVDFYETSLSTSPIYTEASIVGTTFSTSGEFPLVSGRSYGISVRGDAEDPSGASFSSLLPYSFTATIRKVTEGSISILWDAHPGVSTYTVRIDEDISGNTVWTYTTVSGTSLDTTGEFTLVNGTTYSAVVTGTGLGPSASVTSPFFTYTVSISILRLVAANYSGSGAWLDESGNGFHATLASGIAAKNNVGNGIVLNGSTYWTFPNISAGPIWTILLWYKKKGESIPPDQYASILSQLPSNFINLMIGNFQSSDIKAGFFNGTSSGFLTSSPIPFDLDIWKNLAVTYDGSSLLTYLNGTLIDTQLLNIPSVDSGELYHIGRRWDAEEYVVGEIGELRIYSNVQTPLEIQSFYTNTSENYGLLSFITQTVYNSFNLSWESHPGSTTYTVTLYKNPSSVLIYTYTGITGLTLNTGVEVSILNDTLYRISVVGDASGDTTVFSSNYLSNTLYPSVSISSSYTSLVLSWYPSVGAPSYVVQLYESITSATVLSGYTTLLQTYTAVSGTSLTTAGEITVSNTKYYFTRVKVTGQADASYKTAASSLFVWGGGTNLSLTLVNRPNGFQASWTAATGVYQGYTVSIYAVVGSTFLTSVDAGSNLTCDLSSSLFEPGASYYAAITLTNISQSARLLSPTIVYNPLVLSLQATNYSGSGTWADESPYGNNAIVNAGTPSLNVAGNGVVFNGSLIFTCADFGDLPNWSVVTWFKRTADLPRDSAILCQFMDGGNIKLFSANGDQDSPTQLCGGFSSYENAYGGLATFALNEWHQMTVTWDGADIKSYFDGSLYDTASFPNSVATTNGLIYIIGRSWFNQVFIIGEIGALRVYGAAVSPTFVSSYYASTVSTYT